MQMRNKLMIMTLGHEETRARARPATAVFPASSERPACRDATSCGSAA